MFRIHISLILFLLSFFALELTSHGATLIWEGEDPVDGYKVYCGTSSGPPYDSVDDVGNETEYKLSDFNKEGETYYFAVTAYKIIYNIFHESEFSVEKEHLVDDGIHDDDDNCPYIPNGPALGVCTKRLNENLVLIIGDACTRNEECGKVDYFCEMDQLDNNENGIGDACECEADFNGDQNVDSYDNVVFKADFGRNLYNNPCTDTNPCNGDLNCDHSVDTYDNIKFAEDFGRNIYDDPCPPLAGGDWCTY